MLSAKRSKLDEFDEEDSAEYNSNSEDEDVRSLVQSSKLQNSKVHPQQKQTSPTDVVSAVVKKKREVTSLTPANLLGDRGFLSLQQRFSRFQSSSARSEAGDELTDLEVMLMTYRAWAEDLQVREGTEWPDFVEKLDRLKKVEIRKAILLAREGDLKEPFAKSSATKQEPPKEPVLLEKTPLQPTSTQPRPKKPIPPMQPSSQAVPALSEDMKAFIQQKREEALKRRSLLMQPGTHVGLPNDESMSTSALVSSTQAPTQMPEDGTDDCIRATGETAPTQVILQSDVSSSQPSTQMVWDSSTTTTQPLEFATIQPDSEKSVDEVAPLIASEDEL